MYYEIRNVVDKVMLEFFIAGLDRLRARKGS